MPASNDEILIKNEAPETGADHSSSDGWCSEHLNGHDILNDLTPGDFYHASQEFGGEYDQLKQIAIHVVKEFYTQHQGFSSDPDPLISKLNKRFGQKKYRFRYIVRKYFTNASFKIGRIPLLTQIKTARFYLFMVFDRRYKKIIQQYRDDLIIRLREFHASTPQVSIDEEAIMQMLKIISACTLSTYIEQPLRYGSNRSSELKDAYLLGYYLGISYLLDEYAMDNPKLSGSVKEKFHQEVIKALCNEMPAEISFENGGINYLKSNAEKDIPFHKYKDKYRILYLLQRAQYDDHSFRFNDFSIDEIVEKIALIGLKTHMSLYAVQLKQKKSVKETVKEFLLYSLLVQLDDDMRDYFKDKADKVETLFTVNWQNTDFNPHSLYLSLVDHFCYRNRSLKWLYMDYLSHLKKMKTGDDSESLDNYKIRMFIDFLFKFDLKEMVNNLNK